MIARLAAVALLAVAGPVRGAPAAAPGKPPTLSVGVRLQRERLVVTASKGALVRDMVSGAVLLGSPKPLTLRIAEHPKGLAIEGLGAFGRVRVDPQSGSLLAVDAVPYRGSFVVEEDRFGKVSVINLVDAESYLYGVVKAEMPLSAPLEALKAQAVIARTFALKHRDRHLAERGFGLTADTSSQVYAGVRGEDPRARAAVDATRGMVASFKGELIEGLYHSACGGFTQDNDQAFGGTPRPYLRSVPCGYCDRSPGFAWTVALPFDTLLARLLEAGHRLGRIDAVTTEPDPRCQRARAVVLHSGTQRLRVGTNAFRLAVGATVVKGPSFQLSGEPATCPAPGATPDEGLGNLIGEYLSTQGRQQACELRLEGRGSGHGVGLCQSGAEEMARREGRDYDEILAFYYRGVNVTRAY